MAPRKLFDQYQDLVAYAVFGAFTTVVNIVAYWMCSHVLRWPVMASTIVAWFLAVFFAYVTNRRWVFHSANHDARSVLVEVLSFFAARIATGLVDWGLMYVLVDVLGYDDMVVKTVANVVVIALNFIASKLFVFRKHTH